MRDSWWPRFRNRVLPWFGFAAALLLMGLAIAIAWPRPARTAKFSLTAGNLAGIRTRFAQLLAETAQSHQLELELQSSAGSGDALERVDSGEISLAFVQGGLNSVNYPHVRRLASLHVEPLHLLVSDEIHESVSGHLSNLRGKSINVGPVGSGTNELATEVLSFLHLGEGDYTPNHFSYQQLTNPDFGQLPDVVFTVSSLPSPVAQYLIEQKGYRLIAIPFAESFQIHWLDQASLTSDINRRRVTAARIPAFAYQVDPPRPETSIETFGTRLELIANENISDDAADRLCQAVYQSAFGTVFGAEDAVALLQKESTFPLHDGARAYLNRQSPVSTGRVIEVTEQLVGIFGAALGGLLFLWQWLKRTRDRRRDREFVASVQRVVEIETATLAFEQDESMALADLERMQEELGTIKMELIERYRNGYLEGADMLSDFLKHANDASELITRIVLHETKPKTRR